MSTLAISPRKKKPIHAIISQYDVTADVKNRISLRGAQSKYFHVRAFSNGCYVLEPRLLVKPSNLSERSLKTIPGIKSYLSQLKDSVQT